jgi:hypothetical protein
MRPTFPAPQGLGAAQLADRSLWLLFSRPKQILKLSRRYWVLYWVSLVGLLVVQPIRPWHYYPIVALWFIICLPFWRVALAPLTVELFGRPGGRRGRSSGWSKLRSTFSSPWLVHTLSLLEGLSHRQASARAKEMLKDYRHIERFLFFVWLGLVGLLAQLARFSLLSCLPWVVGALDLTVDTQQWFEPVVTALGWALGGLVALGLELSYGLFYQALTDYREGGQFLEALDRDYPP